MLKGLRACQPAGSCAALGALEWLKVGDEITSLKIINTGYTSFFVRRESEIIVFDCASCSRSNNIAGRFLALRGKISA